MWTIAGQKPEAGTKLYTSLIVEAPHDRVELPLFLAAGAKDGPTLLLLAGEHGTELTGPETIRRLFESLPVEKLRGNVAAVPVVNPPAVRSKQHSYPYEKWAWFSGINNLNRLWPGRADGNVAECITHSLFQNLMKHADAVVSLHSTNYRPYTSYMPGDERSKALCLAYGRIPLIYTISHEGCSLHCAREQCGIPAILVEWPPLRFVNHTAVAESMIGLTNLLIELDMIDGTARRISDQYIIDNTPENRAEICAEEDGVLVRETSWGDAVREGDVVARVYDLYRYREIQTVRAPFDGIFSDSGPNPPHLSTFFMHTDSVVKGQRIAGFLRYAEHIENPGGDPWRGMLMGGPRDNTEVPMQ